MLWGLPLDPFIIHTGQPLDKGMGSSDAKRHLLGNGRQWSVAPLSAHGGGNALKGTRAFLPAIRAGRKEVDALFSAIDAVGWLQLGQIVKP